jgi:restriction endonuclease S subunit
VRLSNVDKKSVEGEAPVQLCNYTDVYYNDYITRSIDFMSATATTEQVARFSLCKGDVLITKDSESWSDIAVPAVVTEDLEDVLCGYHLAQVRPGPSVDGRFLARAFASEGIRDQFFVAATGITRYGLSAEDIASAWFPIPPLEEQTVIVDFLNRETQKIDALIAQKHQLMDLLQEKRTAIITRAVTKGLDSPVRMEDSGIAWLGEIPAMWSVKKLKYIVSAPLKYGAGEAAELTDPALPRYIRITDVGPGGRLRQETFRSIPEEVAKPYLLSDGDVLFARSGATVGKTFLYEPSWGRAAYAGYLIRARINDRVADPTFVYYFTQSDAYWDWLHSNFIQATIQNVSAERYAGLKIPLPPLSEQRVIVRHIQDSLRLLERGCQRVTDAIERLMEFRLSLISAAVAGEIDVHEER